LEEAKQRTVIPEQEEEIKSSSVEMSTHKLRAVVDRSIPESFSHTAACRVIKVY